MVKALISWTVSMLLAFQPTAFALTKEDEQGMKRFLELTQITQREVTVKEFYQKIQSGLPEDLRKELKQFVDENPKMKLPKVSVSKVKGANGEEDVQLHFMKNKEAASMTIVARGDVFAKVGKETLTFSDMMNLDRAFAKLEKGIDARRGPSAIPNNSPVFLKSKDILKLDKNSQKKYFKNLRDLLESMEEVQNTVLPKKVSSQEKKSELDFFVSLFITEAHAQSLNQSGGEGTSCIVGGWVSTFKKDNRTGKLSCGHQDSSIATGCNQGQTRCNPAVYGDGRAPAAICVNTGYTVTQECNQYVTANKIDIPDIAKTSADLDLLTERARSQAARLQAICEASYGADASTDAAFKNKFKDQVATCSEFDQRIAEINRWPCSNPEFKNNSNYTRLCEAAGGGQLPPGPGGPTGPTQPGGQLPPVIDANNTCDPQYHIWDGNKKNCHNSQGYISSTCLINGEDVAVRSCTCDGTPEVIGKACPGAAGVDGDGPTRPEKKKSKIGAWFKNNSQTLLLIAGGLVGLGVFHWAVKSWQKGRPMPIEANPPATVPIVTPSTLPPPRPGVL